MTQQKCKSSKQINFINDFTHCTSKLDIESLQMSRRTENVIQGFSLENNAE